MLKLFSRKFSSSATSISSSRSKWKGVFSKIYFPPRYLKLKKRAKKNNKLIRESNLLVIKQRSSTILKKYVGNYFKIYKGKGISFLKMTANHVGHKFGEFAQTCKGSQTIHSLNKKKRK